MARENGGTVFLLQPEVWGSRRPSWTQQKYHGISDTEKWEGKILQSYGGAGSRWIHACWAAC